MLNRAPIFVLGFQRGGTNILVNLLSSHPDTQRLGAEIHEVFYGRHGRPVSTWLKRALSAPLFLSSSPDVLWPYRYHERSALPHLVARYADAIFYANRWTRYRDEDRPEGARSHRDRARARLVAKGVNGVAFATPLLRAMYPDARFVALVRDGFALGESWIRRGWEAEAYARVYQAVCDRIADDAEGSSDYLVVRYEDLVREPVRELTRIYASVGLGDTLPALLKLQAKATVDASGAHRLSFGTRDREIVWVETEHVHEYLRPDVNQRQIELLPQEQRTLIESVAGRALRTFGYA